MYQTASEANAQKQADAQSAYANKYDEVYKDEYKKVYESLKDIPEVARDAIAKESAEKKAKEDAEKAKLEVQRRPVKYETRKVKQKRTVRAHYNGTSSAQRGESLVGEFGSEIVLHKNGTASIVDSPTLMDMEGGEKVFNAKETEDILKSKYKPLKNVNPKKFAMLHAFASGTSSPMQSMIAAQAVGIANGLKNGLVPALATTGGNQTINQTFNVSLPNITDSSKAQDLFKEFEQLQRKATQFFN